MSDEAVLRDKARAVIQRGNLPALRCFGAWEFERVA